VRPGRRRLAARRDHRGRQEYIAELEDVLETAAEERDELEAKLERAEELDETATKLDQLETNRETVETLVEEKESGLGDDEEAIEQRREEAEGTGSDGRREARSRCGGRGSRRGVPRGVVAECNQERQKLRERVERLERVETLLDEVETLEETLERLRDQHDQKGEINDERRERLADKRERKRALAEQFDDEEGRAGPERTRPRDRLRREGRREARRARRAPVGATEPDRRRRERIEELEGLRERREQLTATLERLESLYDEADDLQEMYGTLRAELRQRNVETLERMVNETFDLIYQNDSYARIELDGEYQLDRLPEGRRGAGPRTALRRRARAVQPEPALCDLSAPCGGHRGRRADAAAHPRRADGVPRFRVTSRNCWT